HVDLVTWLAARSGFAALRKAVAKILLKRRGNTFGIANFTDLIERSRRCNGGRELCHRRRARESVAADYAGDERTLLKQVAARQRDGFALAQYLRAQLQLAGVGGADECGLQSAQRHVDGDVRAHGFVRQRDEKSAESGAALLPIVSEGQVVIVLLTDKGVEYGGILHACLVVIVKRFGCDQSTVV